MEPHFNSQTPAKNVHKKISIPNLSWLPFAGKIDEIQPPLEDTELPKLILSHDQSYEYCSPSEFIGKAYTPSANALRINNLIPKKSNKTNPFLKNNKMITPPSSFRLKTRRENFEIKKKRKKSINTGLVTLEDLLSGKYRQKRELEQVKKDRIRERKRLKLEEQVKFDEKMEIQELARLSAVEPIHPDEQLKILLQQTEYEQNLLITDKDQKRIMYYIAIGIDEKYISPFSKHYFDYFKKKLPRHYRLLSNYRFIVNQCHEEIIDYYYCSQRFAIFDYLMNDLEERRRLDIASFPKLFNVHIICAPVPWHSTYILNKHLIYQDLFTMHVIMMEIRNLWNNEYSDMLILPMQRLEENKNFPHELSELEQKIDEICLESRKRLLDEWRKKIADIFLSHRKLWKYYIPKTSSDTLQMIQKFFNCATSVMSIQLRTLVIRSLKHVLSFFQRYREGNNFGDIFEDLMFIQRPFIKVHVIPKIGSKHFTFKPPLWDIKEFICQIFMKIIRVNQKIKTVECIMFPEFCKSEKYLHEVKKDDEILLQILEESVIYFEPNVIGPIHFLNVYKPYKYILTGNARNSLDTFMTKKPFPLIKDFTNRLDHYEGIKIDLKSLRRSIPMNLICLEMQILNDTLIQIIDDLQNVILNYFTNQIYDIMKCICNTFDEMASRISETPETVLELVQLTNYMIECRDVIIISLKEQIRKQVEIISFLMEYATLPIQNINVNTRAITWPQDMGNVLELAFGRIQIRRDKAEKVLKKRTKLFDVKLETHQKQLDLFRKKDPPVLTMEEMIESVATIEEIVANLQEDKNESDNINEEEQLLDFEISPFTNLQQMLATVDPFDKLWHTVLTFHQKYDIWYYGPFKDLDADDIRDEVEAMWSTLSKLTKSLADVPGAKRIAEMVRSKVEKFRQFVPLLETICNKGLQDRHWDMMSEIVGVPLHPKPETALCDMIETGMIKNINQLEEISAAATKEFALLKNLRKMKDEWRDIKFELIPYRESGVSVLSSVDDIQVMLDDHILKAQTMRGSPYVKAFEEEMTDWETKLISMQDIIDAWLGCQSVWMYLEPIFTSEDINRQMPTEARNFKQVDKIWRQIMTHTVNDPHVLIATDYSNMLQYLKENIQLLDEIQKSLNDYLEKKRLFFPRFFFLSNDELLEILSETKDAHRVQPHLKKCFEGIYSLEFTSNDEIIAMISGEKENVPFSGKVVPAEAKGMVEKWLAQIESLMIQSLKDSCCQSLNAHTTSERSVWILTWPGQIVLGCNLIFWTSETIEAIKENTLDKYVDKCTEEIEQSVALVKGNLISNNHITVEALIVIDMHCRDVIHELIRLNVNNAADFNWISQLRYYWHEDNYNLDVCMITTMVAYGYEYLGNVGRLVITPLTDRCYRILMGALKLNLSGALEGPAGTGKTETCKDLAKAVGKKCIVFNCSDGLDYKSIGKFFKGLAQSGAWACFDEFNRIDLKVLSVVAQQILTIQMAVAEKLEKFLFEGTEISLDRTCAIFITMNPGYTGRSELPDNLKVLFRTVAMMVPDYGLIGEITLYSNGFSKAKSLAKKIVYTYKLCTEQLSSQNHYDYGMRAVKSVLLAAGKLKKQYPQQEETELLLRAIIDINLPKLLAQDVPLFEDICTDLFPNVQILKSDRDELEECLLKVLAEKNLQATPWYVEKIKQIYEMILSRHGLMIIGDTLSGKTCAYQSLAETLTILSQNKSAKLKENRVIYTIINPKSITMRQLYGSFDPATHEWSDGVLANIFRSYCVSTTTDRKWILFDGPIDSVWIENLNTVLDDSKKLCLMSGEIIQMPNKMNLIFESTDLEHASPATVSRCGMIYLESKQLGWRSLLMSYMNTLEKVLLPEQMELFSEMVEWLIPVSFEFIYRNCPFFITTSELHLFQNFRRLFSCMLENVQVSTVWIQCVFLFCLSWSFGCTMTGEGRKRFDTFFRKIIYGENKTNPKPATFKLNKNQLFPDRGLIFDYFYDKKNNGTWTPWIETIERVTIPATAKLNEIMVPTNETCCQVFFLNLCLNARIPVLFCGPTGTGKSAIVLNHLLTAPKEKFLPITINFSAQTSAYMTQEIIVTKLDRRRKGVFGPSMGKTCLVFVDDLGMPRQEEWGAQPPIELLRQLIDHGHWFDHQSNKLELVDILFTSAMGVPVGGANEITNRFIRHMFVIAMDAFEDTTLNKIFASIMEWHFSKGYEENVSRFTKILVGGTMEVYKKVLAKFLPIPSKSHYTFSLRDFVRVIQGIILVPSTHLKDPEKLVRLWIHETYRIFSDRLIDDNDKKLLFDIVKCATYQHFRMRMEKVLAHLVTEEHGQLCDEHMRNLFFGNYMYSDADPKIYDEVSDFSELEDKINYYLNEYNKISRTPMHLVMFKYAIEHVSRVSRVLQQENGNCLLVGIDGSGRHSCVKLAAFIAEYQVYEIEITRNYTVVEWHVDLKKLLVKAGVENKPIVFLFADTQITDETFAEDINMILNTGDVPNLYAADEKTDILDKMQSASRDIGKKIETTPLALYNFFIERVRSNLHIAFTISSIGDMFRKRIRMFPSLINCCTIDWFLKWPEDALGKVAIAFFDQTDLESKMKQNCIIMCKYFHKTIEDAVEMFFEELKRRTYITPTSYLELIQTFKNLYHMKVEQISMQKNRYEVGLEKLDFAAGQILLMQQELHDLQPKLIIASEKTEKLMIKIEQDTVVVEKKKEIVGADEALANEAAAAAQAIKDDCESDLAEALPALESAMQALNTLKPADITLVKSMKNPPYGVKLVMEAVCVMKSIKPEKKPDPRGSGRMMEDFWGSSQKMLGDLKFLDSLKAYSKDNISPAIMKRIREKYINDRDFLPENIKTVSTACEGLCKWVRAMEIYDRVIKIVAPKKERLAEAEAELAIQMDTLNEKRAQLQEVADKLQALNDELAAESKKKKDLEDQIELCSQKLDRAEKLIGGLGGEKVRWSETAQYLNGLLHNVVGDVILSAGMVAYLGPFTVDYRQRLITEWNLYCANLGIFCSKPFSLVATLGEPVAIRQWNIFGLPVDNYSIENGIICMKARRWPLMIDPQGQANKWIKNIEKENRLQIIKLTDKNYARKMENAITFGTPILLENILEDIDPVLEPILIRNIYKQAGIDYLKFGDKIVEFNSEFRFYITTRLRNPHYLPDIAVKITLLNFIITPQGLQDQLLGIVVGKDRPELEERKNKLIIESAANKRMLKEIEDQILGVLSASEGNILEDETAIKILSSSKILSEEIQAKQQVAAVTENEIDSARNQYILASKHASALFFCICDLANIDPMYQYSLNWFIMLYNQSIIQRDKSDDLNISLTNLNSHFTKSIYRNVCRSLFEKDKLVFSFVLCISILRYQGKIDEKIFSFFLTDDIVLDNPLSNPASDWLSNKSWDLCCRASTIHALKGMNESYEKYTNLWKQIYDSLNPYEEKLPVPFNNLTGLHQLIALKCIRPDKIIPAVQAYIIAELGKEFTEPPPFNLEQCYMDSNCCSPLVFILSPGTDPIAGLLRFASDMNLKRNRIRTMSLGQEQGPIATGLINSAVKTGDWLVLQNCHLADSWMRELDQMFDEIITPETTHRDFRLWLTSYSSKAFPVSILQNGIKMINEAPDGLRQNLLRSYMSVPISEPEFYDSCTKWREWQTLLFGLCFFHAVIQERKNFGPLGWNIPYEFNESDLRISVLQLQMFLNDYSEVPFDALTYLTGECNYGGRVTDDTDRRLLMSLLSNYYTSETIFQPGHAFSPSGNYHMPQNTNHTAIIDYIKTLPIVAQPEIFGLNENADISKNNHETDALLLGILSTQTRISSGSSNKNTDALNIEIANDILSRMPEQFDIEDVGKKYPIMYTNSMNTVLKQELIRFNDLTIVIKRTLHDMINAFKGLVVMSDSLLDVAQSLTIGKVPKLWQDKSYPSLKSLGSYIDDLLERLIHLKLWIDRGAPAVFWLSGFYFTQPFLTAILQNYSRKHRISIDRLHFEILVTNYDRDAPKGLPENGCYIKYMPNIPDEEKFREFVNQMYKEEELSIFFYGLFLEGARWNRDTHCLSESLPKILYDVIPIIWLRPAKIDDYVQTQCYNCPIYKTSARCGVLSTTGHSTNFVMYIKLLSQHPEKHWINRGVAALCQLND